MRRQGRRSTRSLEVGVLGSYVEEVADVTRCLLGLIEDHTDQGPFWDVALNYRGYCVYSELTRRSDRLIPRAGYNAGTYTAAGGAGTGGAEQANEGVDWLYWGGHWGDAQLPDDDPRQNCIFDIECHYVDGPTGKLLCET